ncbi:hypothetical protein G6K93_05890 [Agrobacterium rhizogenes]|nr:hypothetical protein [Rhizobium rhizogenes]
MARNFPFAAGRLQQAKRHGFVGLFLIILLNDLLTATAVAFVLAGGN